MKSTLLGMFSKLNFPFANLLYDKKRLFFLTFLITLDIAHALRTQALFDENSKFLKVDIITAIPESSVRVLRPLNLNGNSEAIDLTTRARQKFIRI